MTEIFVTLANDKTQPAQGEWTYEDYLALPDDGRRYEIIEGVLYVTNAPDIDHQFAVSELLGEMRAFVKQNKLGYVLAAPFEVHLNERSRPVQPDVFFIQADKWPGSGAKFFEGSPSLVIEVLSPASIRTDRYVKFNAYEQAGVAEYWVVNPRLRTVEVYTLSGGEFGLLGEFTGDEVIQSQVLAGLAIVTRTLFVGG
ncbi:MAG: Uma2 family endonuclease [Anaerolineales bacterium]|nr:Uma2 family endonuclease [Anaerolineales bacterium]